VHHPSFSSQAKKEGPKHKQERKSTLENKDGLTKAKGNILRNDGTRAQKKGGANPPPNQVLHQQRLKEFVVKFSPRRGE